MSDFIEVMAIVEGKTEQTFIESLLAPYLARKMIFMKATQVTKPGQKGGDVCFDRVRRDLGLHLKQRQDTFVTTLVDYYGTRDWPGFDRVPAEASPFRIAEIVTAATKSEIVACFPDLGAERRFIPFMAIHEFEALLFSDIATLASALDIAEAKVADVLAEYGEPEAINDNPQTAPSKRLDGWSKNGKFAKTTAGIAIARKIGIARMREQCPLFNAWIGRFESIVGGGE